MQVVYAFQGPGSRAAKNGKRENYRRPESINIIIKKYISELKKTLPSIVSLFKKYMLLIIYIFISFDKN